MYIQTKKMFLNVTSKITNNATTVTMQVTANTTISIITEAYDTFSVSLCQ